MSHANVLRRAGQPYSPGIHIPKFELAQARLRLITAAAQANEARLRESYAEVSAWDSPANKAALRQALQRAASKGSYPVVRLLLEWGADVNAEGEREVSPLFKAVEGRHQAVANLLLNYKSDPNWHRPRDGISGLFLACLHGLKGAVEALLVAGANPNARDKEGRTPLLYTVAQRSGRWDRDTIRMLVRWGASIEARDQVGKTALLKAASNNQLEAVEDLLNGTLGRTANVSARNVRGLTALYLAAEKNNIDMVNILLRHGADPKAVADGGWTLLHPVAREGYADVLRVLLKAGAAINAQLSNGMTPLHLAASKGHMEIVNLLLAEPGIKLDIKDSFHRTPMICAAFHGYKDIAWVLSPAKVAHRLSPQKMAACKGFEAMIVDFGEFRKQRIRHRHSIYDLLYGWDADKNEPSVPIWPKKVKYEPELRWIHMPANNVEWVETLFAKLLAEEGYRNLESFGLMTECLDQEQQGSFESGHTMRPFCQRAGIKYNVPVHRQEEPIVENVVLFMPFIHYETAERYRKMSNTIAQTRHNGKTIGSSADATLIQGYLNNERPLHVRRTLDQYHNVYDETIMRDLDQVVTRFGRTQFQEAKILMLDQLWLWVIGKDMVISCFPERWDQPNEDPLNVRYSILEALNFEQNFTSNSQLATLILSHCCNIFDSSGVSRDYQFINNFEVSIKHIVNRQTRLLEDFYRISRRSSAWLHSNDEHQDRSTQMAQEGDHDYVLDALLELSEESLVLNDANEIRDELNIIEDILSTQSSILQEFESLITEDIQEREGRRGIAELKRRWRALGRRIDTRQRDIGRMSKRAENIHSNLRSLLELKQMQSNALEAKFARNQGITTSKQGQAILVFTIVTIIFLPMSFIATLFTVEVSEWPNPLTLSYIAKYTFGIGLGISIPLVIVAMTVSDVIATLKGFITGRNRLLRG